MLRYFHRNLLLRLGLAVLVFAAARLAASWLAPAPLTLLELRLQIVGERLHMPGIRLYRDLYTALPPLPALLAWALDGLAGGRSWGLYRLTAAGLLLVQAVLFNRMLNRRNALAAGPGWLPALLYLLVGSVWLELDTLSPLLLGQTFLLAAFGNLITINRNEGYDNQHLFQAGFMLGLAALCYPPLLLFLPVAALAMFFFAANVFRSFLLILVGVAFPYAALATIYLYTGALTGFSAQHLRWEALLPFHPVATLALGPTLVVIAVPAALLLAGVFRSLASGGQLNYQVRIRQLVLAWVGAAGLIVAAGPTISPATLVLVWLPPLAFFGPALIGSGARGWLQEIAFALAISGLAAVRFAPLLPLARWVPTRPLVLLADVPPGQPDPAAGLRGQTVFYFGDDLRAYRYNRLGTPYLDWAPARADLRGLHTYAGLVRLHQMLGTTPPPYLLDPTRRAVPRLQAALPTDFGAYREQQRGVWHRQPK